MTRLPRRGWLEPSRHLITRGRESLLVRAGPAESSQPPWSRLPSVARPLSARRQRWRICGIGVAAGERARFTDRCESIQKRLTALLSAARVGEDAPRDSQQPRQRVGGNMIQPAPRHQERLVSYVLCRRLVAAPATVGDDRRVVRLIQRRETSLPLRSVFVVITSVMSGSPSSVTSELPPRASRHPDDYVFQTAGSVYRRSSARSSIGVPCGVRSAARPQPAA